MKRSAILLTMLGFVALLGLGGWVISGFMRLSHSILPGYAASPSRSMQPYEVVLKYDRRNDDIPLAPMSEWHLKIPRAFIWSELGGNGNIGGAGHQQYFVDMAATIGINGDFSPSVLSNQRENTTNGFYISLRNSIVGYTFSKTYQCIREDEIGEFSGMKKSKIQACDKNDGFEKRCVVYMHYKGWNVRINMPKSNYFGDYVKSCEAVAGFLSKYTVDVDDVRGLGD
ncbi:hypothetical protein [Mesorhizobium sp. B1-1-5]|uniref:hypothetical protein n=1 Tax=Mesorhizobium sp. B1-1-5 TaxID=2589979 RepID=UPI00112B03BC|nr:hypothetical protein [Mesorhizobium sp. B1-1-5]TPO13673.1 hypothetical protein FJ980_00360 [Mesorhizobium sp. B1-1-5]